MRNVSLPRVLVLLVAGAGGLWAQPGDSWGVSFWSRRYEDLSQVVGLQDGGIVVSGHISPGLFSGSFLSRMDGSGRPLWHRRLLSSECSPQVLAAAGDVVYALLSCPPKKVIAKLDLEGNVVWSRGFTRTMPSRIVALPLGGIALSGDELLLVSSATEDYQAFNFTTSQGERISAFLVSQWSDGSYVLAGSSFSKDRQETGTYLWRLSSTGTLAVSWRLKSPYRLQVAGAFDDGSVVLIGSPQAPQPNIDLLVARVDLQGNVLWATTLNGPPPAEGWTDLSEVFFHFGNGFVDAERGRIVVELRFSEGAPPPNWFHSMVFLHKEGSLINAEGVWRTDFRSWSAAVGLHPDGSVLRLQKSEGVGSDSDAAVEKWGGWPELNPSCPRAPVFLNASPGYLELLPASLRVSGDFGKLEVAEIGLETFPMKTGLFCATQNWNADLAVAGSAEWEENVGTNLLHVTVRNLGPKDAHSVFLYGLPEEPTNADLSCWREEQGQGGLVACYLPEIKVGEHVEMFMVLPRGYRLSQVFCNVSAWNPDPNWQNNQVHLRMARRILNPKPRKPSEN